MNISPEDIELIRQSLIDFPEEEENFETQMLEKMDTLISLNRKILEILLESSQSKLLGNDS